MIAKCSLLLLALFILSTGSAFPAEPAIPAPGETQLLTTNDGSTLAGRITRIDSSVVVFETPMGTLTIPRAQIRSIRAVPAGETRGGKYWAPNPNTTRLLFAPTGRMLEKGHGYFADYYVFFPSANYGVTDRISLGGGMSLFPTGNMTDQLYFFTPKVSLHRSERFNVAAGALIIRFPGFDDEEDDGNDTPLVSVIYGVGTWGSRDRSITVAAGYGMVDGKPAEKPLIVLGGERRLTRRTAFISENWIVPGVDNVLVSYGIRLLTESLSTDLALFNAFGGEADPVFPGIPYVDFVWNF